MTGNAGATDDPDAESVMAFWPRILLERNHHRENDPNIVGRPARLQLIQNRSSDMKLHQRDRVSAKSFYSLNKAHLNWKCSFSEHALSVTQLCMQKGWVLCIEDLKAPFQSPFKTDYVFSAAKAAQSAKQKVDSLKARCANTMHATCRLMWDQDIITGIRLTVLATDPYAFERTDVCRDYKGQDGALDFFASRANYGVLPTIIASLGTTQQLDKLEYCGLTVSATQD